MNRKTAELKREDPICLHVRAVSSTECIWMQAGIVNFHMCDTGGDCTGCSYHRSMLSFIARQAPAKGKGPTAAWPERMRVKYPGSVKPCGHFLAGRLQSFTRCRRNYDCDDCPIDLELEYRPMLRAIQTRHSMRLEERP